MTYTSGQPTIGRNPKADLDILSDHVRSDLEHEGNSFIAYTLLTVNGR